MHYKNFKTVTYCVAAWVNHITEEELRQQADFLQKYVGIDKIYLETYRDEFAAKEQLDMFKRVMKDYGIEVSGGITTVTPDINETDKKRQRLFNTFCYCNEPMRARLKEVSEYTASQFDEFIIDDFFFTQCQCEDCVREKGSRSWEEFRLEKMMEVSRELIIGPAKKVNPKVHIIIKYPNWRESFAQTGYNPGQQREVFDSIYTGTETRHGAQTDQHLPRYLSYSLMRYFESVAPGRNGGGWFDPFDCDRIDTYLEQAYLTAFAKPKEIMMFCWPALAGNRRATPLGFMYSRLDAIVGQLGEPLGLKVYIPFNSQGEDHLEDYLGMTGIPMEPVCEFPSFSQTAGAGVKAACNKVLLTASALKDEKVIEKTEAFVRRGGNAIVTGGFVLGALKRWPEQLAQLTSVSYNGRTLTADEFQCMTEAQIRNEFVKSGNTFSFPLIEHRNNATWSIMNAGHGEYHQSILCFDTYGKGKLTILNLPDMPSEIYKLPQPVLNAVRRELEVSGIWLENTDGVSLFVYDNHTFGLYCYTWDGCAPQEFNLHVRGEVNELRRIRDGSPVFPWNDYPILLLYSRSLNPRSPASEKETVFRLRIQPGDFSFFEII